MNETELLKKIFNKKGLSNTERTHKARFVKGTISSKTILQILQKAGYFKKKEAIWMPIKSTV